jgi:hypothetical protein
LHFINGGFFIGKRVPNYGMASLPGSYEMAKKQPLDELEKIRDAMSEAITKLRNDEITVEEANTFTRDYGKRLKEIEKKLKELNKRK